MGYISVPANEKKSEKKSGLLTGQSAPPANVPTVDQGQMENEPMLDMWAAKLADERSRQRVQDTINSVAGLEQQWRDQNAELTGAAAENVTAYAGKAHNKMRKEFEKKLSPYETEIFNFMMDGRRDAWVKEWSGFEAGQRETHRRTTLTDTMNSAQGDALRQASNFEFVNSLGDGLAEYKKEYFPGEDPNSELGQLHGGVFSELIKTENVEAAEKRLEYIKSNNLLSQKEIEEHETALMEAKTEVKVQSAYGELVERHGEDLEKAVAETKTKGWGKTHGLTWEEEAKAKVRIEAARARLKETKEKEKRELAKADWLKAYELLNSDQPDQAIKTLQTSKHISHDAVKALTDRMQSGNLETAPADAAKIMLRIQEGFITDISQAIKEGLNLDMLTDGMQSIEAARTNPMNGTESHLTRKEKDFSHQYLKDLPKGTQKRESNKFIMMLSHLMKKKDLDPFDPEVNNLATSYFEHWTPPKPEPIDLPKSEFVKRLTPKTKASLMEWLDNNGLKITDANLKAAALQLMEVE